jgi:hypothetical protein
VSPQTSQAFQWDIDITIIFTKILMGLTGINGMKCGDGHIFLFLRMRYTPKLPEGIGKKNMITRERAVSHFQTNPVGDLTQAWLFIRKKSL